MQHVAKPPAGPAVPVLPADPQNDVHEEEEDYGGEEHDNRDSDPEHVDDDSGQGSPRTGHRDDYGQACDGQQENLNDMNTSFRNVSEEDLALLTDADYMELAFKASR